MPSDLQVSNIKDLTGSNTGISIASDGQVTISQNNPTITLGSNTTFPSGSILKVFHDEHAFSGSQTVTTSGLIWSDLELVISGVSTSDSMIIQCFIPDIYNSAASNFRLKCGMVYSTDNFGSNAQFGATADIYQDLGQLNLNNVNVNQGGGFAKMTNPATSYKVRLNLTAQAGSVILGAAGAGVATIVGHNIKA